MNAPRRVLVLRFHYMLADCTTVCLDALYFCHIQGQSAGFHEDVFGAVSLNLLHYLMHVEVFWVVTPRSDE